ncbi:MAG: hypothetical protein JNM94_01320 [Phycisphaerae bacterium]|nr:hypothetical protein [Phycisphaerae bacterium]
MTRAAVTAALTLVAAGTLVSCASAPSGDAPLATEQAEAILDRPRTATEQDGLELLRWSVSDDETRIRRAFARHADDGVLLDRDQNALAEAGLRAVVVPDASLPSLLAELGGTSSAITVWHGQMTTWRELSVASFDPSRGASAMAMIDGRAERLSGWLRLMARGWTLPTEDGAVFELTIVPQLVAEKNDLSGLLNRDRLRGRVFDALRVHVELPRDTALVLASEPPDDKIEEDPEGPADADAPTPLRGPPAELPPTLGEMLLTDSAAAPPRRLVLVLRARLPDTLFPEPARAPAPAPPPAPAPAPTPPPPDLDAYNPELPPIDPPPNDP